MNPLNRRGILRLMGLGVGATATAPAVMSANAAAAALGVSLATDQPMPVTQTIEAELEPINSGWSGWWGSDLQIAMEAAEAAHHRIAHGRYAHMKSWGPAFRESVVAREEQVKLLLRRKAEWEQGFADRVREVMWGRP